jgi:SAM-dependent methyltransferase
MLPEKKNPPGSWLEAMRRDWDARARENPRVYINWPDVPDQEEAFFASGRADYDRYVRPFLEKMRFDPRGKSALEIGCGIGRLARCLAADFAEVIGVDVSPEMIARAQAGAVPRTRFLAVSGGDLEGVESASVDFVLSFAVFQHVPDKDAILRYFSETARVLRPGGIFRLHMKGLWTLPLGRLLIEAGFSEKRARARRMPFVRVRILDTWQGRSIPPPEARRACESLGLEVAEVDSAWTNMMWVGGRKPA